MISCMKEPQECSGWLIRKLLSCAALLLAAGCATHLPAGNDRVPSAKVVHQKGSARFKTASSDWQPLKVGDIVRAGTIIQTAKNSRLDLVLGGGSALAAQPGTAERRLSPPPTAGQSTVRLWANTLLKVDKLVVVGTGANPGMETQLDLKSGHIYGVVEKLPAASNYEVKIPNGVAGIRGAVYDLSAEGDVKVLSGTVVLATVGRDGTAVTQVITGSPKSDPWYGARTSTSDPWGKWPVSRRF